MIVNPVHFTPEDYLILEQNSNIRHEYQQGLVYAMNGGSDDHDEITLNLIEIMRQPLKNKDCSVRSGNVKVNYTDVFFYYPNAFVTCDARDKRDRYVKRYPKLVAEVLSPSTAAFDCTEKFLNYQQLASLEEYVIITQDRIEVECRRRIDNHWETEVYQAGQQVKLRSINLQFAIEDLYQGVSYF